MSSNTQVRPPLPPFTRESAIEKIRLAEDGWNSRDPERVSLAYTLIPSGATAPSSPMTGSKPRPSSPANGPRNWTTG